MSTSQKRRSGSDAATSELPRKASRTVVHNQTTLSSSSQSRTLVSLRKRSSLITFKNRSNRSRNRLSTRTVEIEHSDEGEETTIGSSSNVGVEAPTFSEAERLNEECPSHIQPSQAIETDTAIPKKRRERNYENWAKLAEWLPFRQMFLDELLRQDGRGDFGKSSGCSVCDEDSETLYRCNECWDGVMLQCVECLKTTHRSLPFHRIEKWNGRYFEKSSLSIIGVRYQLGHGGQACPLPIPAPKDFVVFHSNGVHSLNLDYCGCRLGSFMVDKKTQLLRNRLFPATLQRPHTAFTFEMLEDFHQLTLQSKLTVYDYYQAIVRRSDNLELNEVPARSNDFHRAFRLWRVLFMLKRAGRGHVHSGIAGTSLGELAIECPACPHPEKNIPQNWSEEEKMLFLYTLFLAVDANFKLKSKDRGLNDIELMPGWAYFVEEEDYQRHLINYVDESEISTCQSEHDAIVRAAVRCTPGYNVTGAGIVICSRHGLVRPNGIGDLQKGERFSNMDYIICSAIVTFQLVRVVITYDIACQWLKNFQKRVEKLPKSMQLKPNTVVSGGVPSWHINAHGPDCQANFALVYMEGCARTCGDEIESGCAETNVLGASIREMSPGGRHDALNDHYAWYNLRKIVSLRKLLARKFRDAAEMRAQHRASFEQLTLTFTPENVVKWTRMILAWDRDPRNPNPYEEVKLETTLQDVRLQLAKEEASEAARGIFSAHQTTMSACIVIGLEIEEQQRVLKLELETSKATTSKQKADLEEKRTGLRRRITQWHQVYVLYAPAVLPLTTMATNSEIAADESNIHPEDIPLHLPSALTPNLRKMMPTLVEKESRLREAQADDALADIRHQRRILTGLHTFKKIQLAGAGNKPNTRVRSLYNRIQAKIDKSANRYRTARAALEVLDPNGNWRYRLKELHSTDIRGPGRDPGDTSNGRYLQSWIWTVNRVPSEKDSLAQDELNESLRVEWAKARARLRRWEEEYSLVLEEMRRVVVYLGWKAQWWREHAVTDAFRNEGVMEGIRAYAHKQADLWDLLARRYSDDWVSIVRRFGEIPPWKPWATSEGTDFDQSQDTVSKGQPESHHLSAEGEEDIHDGFTTDGDDEQGWDPDQAMYEFDLD